MPRIFISYRRSDSIAIAGRIHDKLETAFGDENVFKDVDDIPPGVDFRQVLDHEVGACDVLLVIIGKTWPYVTNADGKLRLQDPDDFVRIEVESGLKRDDVLTIPVLVDNAPMPKPDDLPASLRDLTYRNAVILRHDPDFNRDISRLIEYIQNYGRKQQARPALLQRLPIVAATVIIVGILGLLIFSQLGNPAPATSPTPNERNNTTTGIIPNTPLAQVATNTPITPTTLNADINSARAQFEAGHYDEALRHYTLALRDDLQNPLIYLERARVHEALEDYAAAEHDAQQAVTLDADNGEAHYLLGLYRYHQGQYREALDPLQQAADLLTSAAPYILLGDAYSADYEYEEARDAYEQALTRDNNNAEIHVNLARVYGQLEAYDKQWQQLDFALALNPDFAEAHAMRGYLYYARGDYEQALQAYTTAIDNDGGQPAYYKMRGEIYATLAEVDTYDGDPERAIDSAYWQQALLAYNQALEVDPNDFDTLRVRGHYWFDASEYENAIADYARMEAIDPGHGYMVVYGNYAKALVQLDRHEEALNWYNKAIYHAYEPGIWAFYVERAAVHRMLNQDEQAKQDLETIINEADKGTVQPDTLYDAYNAYADLQSDLGNDEMAADYRQRAEQLLPELEDD